MEEFYKEITGRLDYLKTLEQTEENKIRINEITLAIVKVQQILLKKLLN